MQRRVILPTRQTRTSARPRLSVTWGVGNSNFSKLWRSKSDFIADSENQPDEVHLVRGILQSYYLCFKFAPHVDKNDEKCLKLSMFFDVFGHYDKSKIYFSIPSIEMTSVKCFWCPRSIKLEINCFLTIFFKIFLLFLHYDKKINFHQYVRIFQRQHPALRFSPGGNQVDGLPSARNTPDPTNQIQCSSAGIYYLRRRKFKFLKTLTLKNKFIADTEIRPNEVYLVRRISLLLVLQVCPGRR